MKMVKMKWLIGIMGMMLLLSGCSLKKEETATTEETSTEIAAETTTVGETEETTESGEVDKVTLDGMSRDILANMSLEEKVGQMFFFGLDALRTDGKTGKTKKLSKTMEEMLAAWRPGGIILYSKNMKNQEQTKTLISDLQSKSRIPLFVGTEEAGGEYSKIASKAAMEIENTPTSAVLGAGKKSDVVEETAEYIASYMKELGFCVNFAPSAQLTQEENSTLVGENSYGSDPNVVSKMIEAFVSGMQSQGVSAVLSTFPGVAVTTNDTRKGSVDITKTINELRKSEFLPFKAGIEAGTEFIKVGHASYSAIMGNQTPASLSKLMVTEILRKELLYESIIITDSMNEKAVTDVYSVEEAAVKAVKAGVDMLLYPTQDGIKAYQAVLSAVEAGQIEESRIDESVLRILKVKIQKGLISLDTNLIN